MNVLIETPLHNALTAHRAACAHCQRDAARPRFSQRDSCPEYFAISQRATDARKIYEGPLHSHTWLSIREAAHA